MPKRKLFGTDGVRGEVGTFLTPELATSLGRAATSALDIECPQVLIIRDTRESGPMLEAAVAAGVAASGGNALIAGVLPTPGASVLVRRLGLDLAAVISASHNPWRDNGIKFFGSDGMKLDDATEARLELLLGEKSPEQPTAEGPQAGASVGRVRELRGALTDYLRELEGAFRLDLTDTHVLLDCANGATHRAAPQIFERLGATVTTVGAEPDGRNINEGCGSTHVERLGELIGETDASIGFAFDGDGDRMLAVDREGRVHDGDELIALAASHLSEQGRLSGGIAVTVMTNFGFHQAMKAAGIEVATTSVGDRYVIEELRRRSWNLGGEQSGHIIAMDFTPTGDGIAAALLTMQALGGRDLASVKTMEKLPQKLVNVRVADRDAISGATAVWEAVKAEDEKLGDTGRVLVRPSGTEPLVRVMVEAPTLVEADEVCSRLVELVERDLA